jgi:transposase
MEACGSSHHWARFAEQYGHTPLLLPTKVVTPFRKGHKTDKNDALAIAIAAKQPQVKSVAVKTVEEQSLQGIERMRKHHSDAITATGNLLRGLVYEFGITIPKGPSALKREIPAILEDPDNLLPNPFRRQLANMYQFYLVTKTSFETVEKDLFNLIKQNKSCLRIMALEGIGPVNALGLTLSLGKKGQSFKNGREASACIGLTPKQYSTGGIVTLGGIGKNRGNKLLRSTLIQGSMAAIKVLKNAIKIHPENKGLKENLEVIKSN